MKRLAEMVEGVRASLLKDGKKANQAQLTSSKGD